MADHTLLPLLQAVEDLQHQLLALETVQQLLQDSAVGRDTGLAVLLGTVTSAVNLRVGAVQSAAKALVPSD